MPYRILSMDDDIDFREELSEIPEDCNVLETANGKEAIAIIKRTNIVDLVVLDIKIPGLQRTEALKQIKALDVNIFVIMLTGHSQKDMIYDPFFTLKAKGTDPGFFILIFFAIQIIFSKHMNKIESFL